MSDRRISDTARHLIKARERIADTKNWCQGELENEAGKVCALGALSPINWELAPAYSALTTAAQKLFDTNVASVNDSLGHAAVLRMYDEAIQAELSKSGRE